MMLKHRSQKGRPSLWKKLGSSNGRSQPCKANGQSSMNVQKWTSTYLAHKTAPTPLATQRLHSLHAIAYALLALTALGHSQAYMARLTIRMAVVHSEAHVVGISFISIEGH
jgi:hypothetical protein